MRQLRMLGSVGAAGRQLPAATRPSSYQLFFLSALFILPTVVPRPTGHYLEAGMMVDNEYYSEENLGPHE